MSEYLHVLEPDRATNLRVSGGVENPLKTRAKKSAA